MTTLRKWLGIYSDLDAYIAKGGQLLDLEMSPPMAENAAVKTLIVEHLGVERLERLARFHSHVADAMSGQAKETQLGNVLNEDQMRAMWRETANAAPIVAAGRIH